MGPVIPANINDLSSIRGTLSDMIDMALQAHHDCDIGSDTECGGEQYGDGSADEHCRLRDAEATVKLLRLAASAPELLAAIATAGRIVGQVQDNPKMSASERAYALSRALDALGGTYFKTTRKPLEWWQSEPAIAKATGRGRGD